MQKITGKHKQRFKTNPYPNVQDGISSPNLHLHNMEILIRAMTETYRRR